MADQKPSPVRSRILLTEIRCSQSNYETLGSGSTKNVPSWHTHIPSAISAEGDVPCSSAVHKPSAVDHAAWQTAQRYETVNAVRRVLLASYDLRMTTAHMP